MKVFFLLFIALFFTSCDSPIHKYELQKLDKYCLANAVVAETAFQLKRDKNLIPFGSGRNIGDQINMLSLTFICYKETGIDEARELLIEAVQVMTHVINSNKEIRPYLCEYPFDANHLEIAIFFEKENDTYNFGKLSICSIDRGELKYNIRHSRYDFTTVLSETYEEAEKKLKCIDL